jgi:RNA 2',3'-cyclic 3'-phosphodiesterase
MRLFVALELPAGVRAGLGALAARLRASSGSGVRWTDPNGIHLTLKFIGEIESSRVGAIRNALAEVHAAQPIDTAFRGIGWFPNARHPRVFWAGVEADPTLAGLAAEVERALEALGIAREEREFRPHLTLARIKSEAGLDGLRREVESVGTPDFGRAAYSEFDLMQSVLHPKGAVYTRLERFAFAAAAHAGLPQAGGTGGGALQ